MVAVGAALRRGVEQLEVLDALELRVAVNWLAATGLRESPMDGRAVSSHSSSDHQYGHGQGGAGHALPLWKEGIVRIPKLVGRNHAPIWGAGQVG